MNKIPKKKQKLKRNEIWPWMKNHFFSPMPIINKINDSHSIQPVKLDHHHHSNGCIEWNWIEISFSYFSLSLYLSSPCLFFYLVWWLSSVDHMLLLFLAIFIHFFSFSFTIHHSSSTFTTWSWCSHHQTDDVHDVHDDDDTEKTYSDINVDMDYEFLWLKRFLMMMKW